VIALPRPKLHSRFAEHTSHLRRRAGGDAAAARRHARARCWCSSEPGLERSSKQFQSWFCESLFFSLEGAESPGKKNPSFSPTNTLLKRTSNAGGEPEATGLPQSGDPATEPPAELAPPAVLAPPGKLLPLSSMYIGWISIGWIPGTACASGCDFASASSEPPNDDARDTPARPFSPPSPPAVVSSDAELAWLEPAAAASNSMDVRTYVLYSCARKPSHEQWSMRRRAGQCHLHVHKVRSGTGAGCNRRTTSDKRQPAAGVHAGGMTKS
jgi:hypothetical protein